MRKHLILAVVVLAGLGLAAVLFSGRDYPPEVLWLRMSDPFDPRSKPDGEGVSCGIGSDIPGGRTFWFRTRGLKKLLGFDKHLGVYDWTGREVSTPSGTWGQLRRRAIFHSRTSEP